MFTIEKAYQVPEFFLEGGGGQRVQQYFLCYFIKLHSI